MGITDLDETYIFKVFLLGDFNAQVGRNRGKHPPKIHTILTKSTPSHLAYQRTLKQKFQAPIYKNVEFRIFCQKTNHGCVFIVFFLFFFFFPGVIVSTKWS